MSAPINNEKECNKRDRENEGKNNEVQDLNLDKDSRSPIAKRIRQEGSRMESWKDNNPEKELITITIVINDLIQKTSNGHIRKLIDCYNPLIHEETDMMMNHILSCCADWDCKEETLREAISYVWPENDFDLETDDIERLAELLLISIETLTPKYCKECDHHYIVQKENTPAIRCMWCRGGAHDCVDRGNKQKLKGMIWMCRVCDDTVTKQILPKISLVRKMELMKKETSINFEGFDDTKEKERSKSEAEKIQEGEEEAIVVDEIEEEKVDGDKDNENDDTNEEGNGRDNDANNVDGRKKDENNDNKKVCWWFENRKCKFGANCKELHPETCKPMQEYGKCGDSKCKLLHQKICRNYYNQGYCTRYNCWFVHPTKIAERNPTRPPTPGSQIRNFNNRNQLNRPPNGMQNNINNNSNFLWNWPTPQDTTMNMQQILSKLVGTIEKVDSRIEKLEMRHANQWNY